MKKIVISKEIESEFKDLVFSIFKKKANNYHLIKKENKKIKFDLTLKELNEIISKKLQKFDKNIDFEKLIVADFDYLQKLVQFIDRNSNYTKLNKEKEYFYTLYERLNKPKFVKCLNIKTCLYCNRNFILNFKKGKDNKATAQLDHFFNKRDYPYLAINLYNLIPSCSTCNLRKSNKQVNIFHPYTDDFDKIVKFSLTITNSNFYHSTNGFDISLVPRKKIVTNNLKEKINNHIEVFNLKALYDEHKDIILELIQKKYMYDDSYLDELTKKYEGTLFKNREDLMRLISGGYISEDEINKRPLSKLIKDISEDLDLI